jgi:hypothetical protein
LKLFGVERGKNEDKGERIEKAQAQPPDARPQHVISARILTNIKQLKPVFSINFFHEINETYFTIKIVRRPTNATGNEYKKPRVVHGIFGQKPW